MRKENTTPNVDALLREIAAQDNAALPFDDWRRALLQKTAGEDTHPSGSTAGSVLPFHAKEEAGAPVEEQHSPLEIIGSDMRDERRFARKKKTRRVMLGLSGAAAALLALLGVRQLLPGGFGANQTEDSLMAGEAAPFSMALPESGEKEMVEPPMMPAPAAAPDTQSSMPAQPAAESPAGGMDDSEGRAEDARAGGAGNTGGEPASGAAPDGALRSEAAADASMLALLRVEEALGMQGTGASRAHAEIVSREGSGLRYTPLTGSAQDSGRDSAVPDTQVYLVTLDARQESAARYVVRQDTLAVLGTLVE